MNTPQLPDINKCSGCMACYNVCRYQAIEIVKDEEGFLQPKVKPEICVGCKLCEKACPIVTPGKFGVESPAVYAVWHKKDRRVSSSGGAFSAIARIILAQKGVVFGAAFDKGFRLRHYAVDNIADLSVLRGSKYVQSEIGDIYKQVAKCLNDGKKVFFCGTPCQVAGLRGFLRKDYDNLYAADLVCHGVPSNDVFQGYLRKLEHEFAGATYGGHIEKYEFRCFDGWGKQSSITIANQIVPLYGIKSIYMEAFNKNVILRKSCYSCPFARIPRVADLTLGDFWGIGRRGIPFKHDVRQGVSLVLVNSEKGEKIISAFDTNTFVEKRTIEEAVIGNHNLKNVSTMNAQRDEVIQAFLDNDMTLEDIERRYRLVDYSIKGRIKIFMIRVGVYNGAKVIYNWYKTL